MCDIMIPMEYWDLLQILRLVFAVLFIIMATIDFRQKKLSNKIGIVILLSGLSRPFYITYAISFLALGLWLLGDKYKYVITNKFKFLDIIGSKNVIYYYYLPIIIAIISFFIGLMYFYYPATMQVRLVSTLAIMMIYTATITCSAVIWLFYTVIVTILNYSVYKNNKLKRIPVYKFMSLFAISLFAI